MKHFLTFAIIFAIVCACTPQPTPALTTIPSHPTATSAPVQPTATSTEVVTPTSTPDSHLTLNCPDILPEVPTNSQFSGTLVLGTFYGRTNKSYLLNLQTGKKILLRGRDDEFLQSFSISPDSHLLAYTSMRTKETWTDRLVIMGADGKPVKDRLISTREWIYMDGWINNQMLLFEKYDPINYDRYGGPLATVVYNPFTNEQKQLNPTYPDIVEDGERLPDWSYTETIYDPTFSLVLYPHKDRKNLILWNRETNKEIAHFPRELFNDNGAIPVWSPDGSLMLTRNYQGKKDQLQIQMEIFGMNRSGAITRLTYLSDSHPNSWPAFLSWSPNMQHIAFWLHNLKSDIYHLAVLDPKAKLVTDYCLEGLEHYKNMGALLRDPKWSPDSQKLLINIPNGPNNTKVVIVDFAKGYAAVVAEDMMAMGWLTDKH